MQGAKGRMRNVCTNGADVWQDTDAHNDFYMWVCPGGELEPAMRHSGPPSDRSKHTWSQRSSTELDCLCVTQRSQDEQQEQQGAPGGRSAADEEQSLPGHSPRGHGEQAGEMGSLLFDSVDFSVFKEEKS